MGFQLQSAGSLSAVDAGDADVRRAFDSDSERGEFVILDAPDGSFMQAAGEGKGPFLLEHRASSGSHIKAVGQLTKAQVEEAFLSFLHGDEAWRTKLEWEPLKKKAGCLSAAGLLTVLLGLIVALAR